MEVLLISIAQFSIDEPIILAAIFLLIGVAVVLPIFLFYRDRKRVWSIVDLVWIVVGGVSAAGALASTIYIEEREDFGEVLSNTRSQMQFAISIGNQFDARHCQGDFGSSLFINELRALCENTSGKVRQIELLLSDAKFIEEFGDTSGDLIVWGSKYFSKTEAVSPGEDELLSMGISVQTGNCIDLKCYEEFNFFQEEIAKRELSRVFVFDQLINDHDLLSMQLQNSLRSYYELNRAWLEVLSNLKYLAIRSFSLALLAFAFPFRVGKSLRDVIV